MAFVRESIFRHSAVDEHAQLVQGSVTSAGPGLAGGTTMGLEPEPWCSWVHKKAPGEMESPVGFLCSTMGLEPWHTWVHKKAPGEWFIPVGDCAQGRRRSAAATAPGP